MICGENFAAQRQGEDDQHEEFSVVLNWLVKYELGFNKGNAVLADVVAVWGSKGVNV